MGCGILGSLFVRSQRVEALQASSEPRKLELFRDAAPRLQGGCAFACDCLHSTVHIPARSVRQASHAVFGQRTTPGLGQWRSLRRP